jgi:hypothetical protein
MVRTGAATAAKPHPPAERRTRHGPGQRMVRTGAATAAKPHPPAERRTRHGPGQRMVRTGAATAAKPHPPAERRTRHGANSSDFLDFCTDSDWPRQAIVNMTTGGQTHGHVQPRTFLYCPSFHFRTYQPPSPAEQHPNPQNGFQPRRIPPVRTSHVLAPILTTLKLVITIIFHHPQFLKF